MTQKHSNDDKGHRHPAAAASREPDRHGMQKRNGNSHTELFSRFAHETARMSGKPGAFILAAAVIVIWGITGPIFNYSDTWQLVINTGTTIVTFLMVFLIQNTQNRDTMALQIKLSELIIAVRGAHNSLAAAEDLTEEELERLHKEYCTKAESTLGSLEKLRADRKKK
jgi:low affinity Fe/Cu permease